MIINCMVNIIGEVLTGNNIFNHNYTTELKFFWIK